MTKTPDKEVVFNKIFPCINVGCDNNGSIAVRDLEGDWEQGQCEYCFKVRFPARKLFYQELDSAKEEERARCWQVFLSGLPIVLSKAIDETVKAHPNLEIMRSYKRSLKKRLREMAKQKFKKELADLKEK